jgi:rhodanese-related sulfurtransferase
MKVWVVIFILVFGLVGCTNEPSPEAQLETFNSIIATEGVKLYDLRNVSTCNQGHIQGFRCMMGSNLDGSMRTIEDIIALMKLEEKDQTMVFICEYGNDSKVVYQALSASGYKNVHYFSYGYVGYVNMMKDAFTPVVGCDEC